MIRSKRGLFLAAALTVVLALIVSFPARIAYQWASPSEFAMSGIRGTVWRGNADAVGLSDIYLSDLHWRFKPMQLFTGKAAYSLEASPVSGFVEGNIGVSISGTLSVSDLTASLPLHMFAKAFNVRGLQGNASVQFERVELRDGLPVAANGTVQVNDLIAPRLSRDSIGGYRADFFTQNNGVAASIEDTDGVVDFAGSLQIKDDRSYQLLGQVVAKPEASAGLKKQLQYLPTSNEPGKRELRVEGTL